MWTNFGPFLRAYFTYVINLRKSNQFSVNALCIHGLIMNIVYDDESIIVILILIDWRVIWGWENKLLFVTDLEIEHERR